MEEDQKNIQRNKPIIMPIGKNQEQINEKLYLKKPYLMEELLT